MLNLGLNLETRGKVLNITLEGSARLGYLVVSLQPLTKFSTGKTDPLNVSSHEFKPQGGAVFNRTHRTKSVTPLDRAPSCARASHRKTTTYKSLRYPPFPSHPQPRSETVAFSDILHQFTQSYPGGLIIPRESSDFLSGSPKTEPSIPPREITAFPRGTLPPQSPRASLETAIASTHLLPLPVPLRLGWVIQMRAGQRRRPALSFPE